MSDKTLSILFRKNGFSFCVIRQGEIVHFGEETFSEEKNLNALFSSGLYFQQKYEKVHVAILTNQFNLIPEDYFDKDPDAQKWLEFNAEVFENDEIRYENIEGSNIKLVYALPSELGDVVQEQFGKTEIRNASAVFIESIKSDATEPQIFINVHVDVLEILITKTGKIQFYNIFETATREDVVYHILNVLKQLKLDPNSIELYYFGWNHEHEALKMLMNFVRHVMPGTSESNLMQHYTEIQNAS